MMNTHTSAYNHHDYDDHHHKTHHKTMVYNNMHNNNRHHRQHYAGHPHHPPQGYSSRIRHHEPRHHHRPHHHGHYRKSGTDMEEVAANFLLTLKHRSVTPEPLVSENEFKPLSPSFPTTSWSSNDKYSSCPPLYNEPQQPSSSASASSAAKSSSYQHHESTPSLTEEPIPTTPSDTTTTSKLESWDVLIGDSKLVLMKDQDLVPDALFVAMAQMQPCTLTQADRVGCYKTREIGFIGMACKHCNGQPGFGRYYPNSVRSLAQTTTSQTILKHVGAKCRFCPPEIRKAVLQLQQETGSAAESASAAAAAAAAGGRPRYGSRKVFFQRVWARLHGGVGSSGEEDDGSESNCNDSTSVSTPKTTQIPSSAPVPHTSHNHRIARSDVVEDESRTSSASSSSSCATATSMSEEDTDDELLAPPRITEKKNAAIHHKKRVGLPTQGGLFKKRKHFTTATTVDTNANLSLKKPRQFAQ